ncbi:TetR/AcrR family transcriptional regulator [Aldersonia sp. NBC_00410]|jgi:AcrR family transcriptional regulator|uniref:TetR/AcrR family transcriptional regulator n=1 Tax=Aldersonia sp. NBC_00410 TaxID=2975954 RepID=UPI002257EB49|nr:TetR/AcrR family transcriptional regulator [Aldersonia sp. NBC_00410]MCX5041891.1 TetR/AcrR family transcriptional regulator [Aldersonia sp. NBC_00410]
MTQEVSVGRTYAGQPVEDRQRERRSRFLESGLTVFARDGYANSSVGAICRDAGLSSRQFYEEFTGREALLIELYIDIEQTARNSVAAALVATSLSADPVAYVDSATRAYIDSIGGDPRKARVSLVEVVGASTRVEEKRTQQRREWSALLDTIVRRAAKGGGIPAGDLDIRVSALMGAVNYVVYDWSVAEPRRPLDDVVRVLRRMLLGAIVA